MSFGKSRVQCQNAAGEVADLSVRHGGLEFAATSAFPCEESLAHFPPVRAV